LKTKICFFVYLLFPIKHFAQHSKQKLLKGLIENKFFLHMQHSCWPLSSKKTITKVD